MFPLATPICPQVLFQPSPCHQKTCTTTTTAGPPFLDYYLSEYSCARNKPRCRQPRASRTAGPAEWGLSAPWWPQAPREDSPEMESAFLQTVPKLKVLGTRHEEVLFCRISGYLRHSWKFNVKKKEFKISLFRIHLAPQTSVLMKWLKWELWMPSVSPCSDAAQCGAVDRHTDSPGSHPCSDRIWVHMPLWPGHTTPMPQCPHLHGDLVKVEWPSKHRALRLRHQEELSGLSLALWPASRCMSQAGVTV